MMLAQKDHYSGMTNPVQLFGSSYGLPLKPELPPNCFDILHPRLYREAFQKSRPPEADYDSLCQYLKYLHDEGIDEPIESVFDFTTAGRIEPGDSTPFMPRIAKRLYEMKYMKARDTALASPYFYNHAMLSYIKQFQFDRGLQNDGIIGANTFIHLNFTRVKLQMEAMANLERIRWLHIDTSVHMYLRVNLPEFRLFMHYPDSVHSMKVCIGKQNSTDYDKRYAHYLKTKKWQDKPRNFETPQIYSRISHLVLNPTWTVPNSIVAREMYPHMIKDPYYLKKNNYIVLYKDKVYPNPENIRWYKYKANALPFKFVQESGDDNALGKIKFIFPNPYNIYLHDTPLKSKFNQNERSVSHGCVRVQDPLNLALFTSIQMDQYDFDDMRILMGYLPLDSTRAANYDPLDSNARIKPATQTVSIFLHRRIPIYFDYRTMYWDEKGTFWWRNDVYRKNHVIVNAILRSGFKNT
jgi:murein L,D-transpeptidase YcbB/YkuD